MQQLQPSVLGRFVQIEFFSCNECHHFVPGLVSRPSSTGRVPEVRRSSMVRYPELHFTVKTQGRKSDQPSTLPLGFRGASVVLLRAVSDTRSTSTPV
jgi:hypothetical protein